eukprot:NODE_887_length_1258_cov_159.649297_g658_i1.p1 GENE.NODE_887_length_1258_cov_159.649297_g658_i1~~NODE_887_length_1258_cov_159.649297_g658_i1.p1  ORF type:complete len:403 (+),score=54.09 NODE_887_length_1258_cov_159.649297_g658_i1:32-1210(+)
MIAAALVFFVLSICMIGSLAGLSLSPQQAASVTNLKHPPKSHDRTLLATSMLDIVLRLLYPGYNTSQWIRSCRGLPLSKFTCCLERHYSMLEDGPDLQRPSCDRRSHVHYIPTTIGPTFSPPRMPVHPQVPDTDHSKLRVLVIVARKRENVSWLRTIRFPYVVLQKAQPQIYRNDIPNVGKEEVAYLKYIVDHYCTGLPEHLIFLHAHHRSWHQRGQTNLRLNALNISSYPFASLNDHTGGMMPNCGFSNITLLNRLRNARPLLGTPDRGCMSQYVCCAQFLVHRSRIHQIPLSLWQEFYVYATSGPGLLRMKPDKSREFEYVWHLILGPGWFSPPPLAHCLYGNRLYSVGFVKNVLLNAVKLRNFKPISKWDHRWHLATSPAFLHHIKASI